MLLKAGIRFRQNIYREGRRANIANAV